jgi:poly(A) polymerase
MKVLERHLEINSKYFLLIIELLKSSGAEARLVGGAVRDALLERASADIDIATNLTPDRVTELLTQHDIKVIPTGIKFGTVTAIIKNESFEITTLRADLDCDGRHAKVVYSNDFAEDAARRDFTINALSYCPVTNVIYDYFDGVADLEAQKVIFVGNAEKRIQEDYLRILRFFRFSCRYANQLDAQALVACIANKDKLPLLSGERIKSELDLLLPLAGSADILDNMFAVGVLEQILPINNYNKNLHIKALKVANSFGATLELSVIYAVLFSSTDISYNKLLALKFSRTEARVIMKMLELTKIGDTTTIITILKNIWLEEKDCLLYFIYASLTSNDSSLIYDLYNNLNKLKIPTCPVNSNDLVALGYSGQALGVALDLIKKTWVESDFLLNRSQLIKLVNNREE